MAKNICQLILNRHKFSSIIMGYAECIKGKKEVAHCRLKPDFALTVGYLYAQMGCGG